MDTYEAFNEIIMGNWRPVVLVEGTRKLPESDEPTLVAFAKWMAQRYKHAVFRTGNADGSDRAFARGVAEVDASRIEYILPYSGHKSGAKEAGAREISLSSLTRVAEDNIAAHTTLASPGYKGMIDKRDSIPELRAKAKYILRDTIKVTGAVGIDMPPATVGIFYVNGTDPMSGGTGHTIRVCRQNGVPAIFQSTWMKWPLP